MAIRRLADHIVFIQAPPARVWETMIDTTIMPEWDQGMDWIRLWGPLKVGTWGMVKQRRGLPTLLRISDVVPGIRYSSDVFIAWLRVIIDHHVEAVPSGSGSRVIFTVDIEGPGRHYISGWLGPLFRRGLPIWMDNLKRRLEKTATQ